MLFVGIWDSFKKGLNKGDNDMETFTGIVLILVGVVIGVGCSWVYALYLIWRRITKEDK